MAKLFSILLLPPIYKALISLMFAGFAFPLTGVMITRLNLLSVRYTLMHALLLGGVISLAFNLPTLLSYIVIGMATLVVMIRISKKVNLGLSSAVLMVFVVALASILTSVFSLQAKDTLELLWGSPFTISYFELGIFIALAFVIVGYILLFYSDITSIFFDKELAIIKNKNNIHHEHFMIFLIGITISISMRFVGALLLDALLLLPVLVALKRARSLKHLFVLSSIIGFFTSIAGFLLSLVFNLPPAATIAGFISIVYVLVPKRRTRYEN